MYSAFSHCKITHFLRIKPSQRCPPLVDSYPQTYSFTLLRDLTLSSFAYEINPYPGHILVLPILHCVILSPNMKSGYFFFFEYIRSLVSSNTTGFLWFLSFSFNGAGVD